MIVAKCVYEVNIFCDGVFKNIFLIRIVCNYITTYLALTRFRVSYFPLYVDTLDMKLFKIYHNAINQNSRVYE